MKIKRSDIIAFAREIMLEYIKPAKESDVDPSELEKGISVEMEHTNDPKKAKVIALQHLAEDPKYYTKLTKANLEEKIKGLDGKACWKGYRYAGTKDGKDRCVKVSVNEEQSEFNKIGPFFHETDSENIDSIAQKGIEPKKGYVSLSPGGRTGHYGDVVFKVYLTPSQFKTAVEETLEWVGSDMKEHDILDIQELLESDAMEMVILANEMIQDPLFMMGELVCPFPIPSNQIKLLRKNLNEEESFNKTIIYPDFQGSDLADNITGEIRIVKVSNCLGNEPNKDLNYFNTEKKSYIEKMIKAVEEEGIESFPPVVALDHPLMPGKYLVLDGNHRLGAFKIGNIPEIKAIIVDNVDVVLATPDTEWEEGIVPETITMEDAKSQGVDLKRYFNTEELSEEVKENYADGKVKGKSRPGRVKKAGASCKGSVTSLRAKAKKYGGEKGKMYNWCANMKGGKK